MQADGPLTVACLISSAASEESAAAAPGSRIVGITHVLRRRFRMAGAEGQRGPVVSCR
jgi:hypothetical protein